MYRNETRNQCEWYQLFSSLKFTTLVYILSVSKMTMNMVILQTRHLSANSGCATLFTDSIWRPRLFRPLCQFIELLNLMTMIPFIAWCQWYMCSYLINRRISTKAVNLRHSSALWFLLLFWPTVRKKRTVFWNQVLPIFWECVLQCARSRRRVIWQSFDWILA